MMGDEPTIDSGFFSMTKHRCCVATTSPSAPYQPEPIDAKLESLAPLFAAEQRLTQVVSDG